MPPKRAGVSGSGAAGVPYGGTPATTTPLTPQQQQQQEQVLALQQQLRALRNTPKRASASVSRLELVRLAVLFAFSVSVLCLAFMQYGVVCVLALLVLLWFSGFLDLLKRGARWVIDTTEVATYSEALRRADIMMDPIVTKHTSTGENASLAYGCSCMQGWRRTMEDAHTMEMLEDGGFFAVYDGHSGASTAQFCGDNMYKFVSETTAFATGNYTKALYDGFIAVDRFLHSNPVHERSGCTAVVVFIKGDELYCANAGDSRSVLCREGEAVPLSEDHKPYMTAEQTRIERAGGFVWNKRVNGILALSRAIGDFGFKGNTLISWDQQAVTSAPEVQKRQLNRDKDEFIVIACDGIWDMMTNEQVVEFVRPRIQQRVPLGRIAEQLMDNCISPHPFGAGCDNMSVIIIQLKRRPHVLPPSLQSSPRLHSTRGSLHFSMTEPREDAAASASQPPASPGDTPRTLNPHDAAAAATATVGSPRGPLQPPQASLSAPVLPRGVPEALHVLPHGKTPSPSPPQSSPRPPQPALQQAAASAPHSRQQSQILSASPPTPTQPSKPPVHFAQETHSPAPPHTPSPSQTPLIQTSSHASPPPVQRPSPPTPPSHLPAPSRGPLPSSPSPPPAASASTSTKEEGSGSRVGLRGLAGDGSFAVSAGERSQGAESGKASLNGSLHVLSGTDSLPQSRPRSPLQTPAPGSRPGSKPGSPQLSEIDQLRTAVLSGLNAPAAMTDSQSKNKRKATKSKK